MRGRVGGQLEVVFPCLPGDEGLFEVFPDGFDVLGFEHGGDL